jgi:hypothetical protein
MPGVIRWRLIQRARKDRIAAGARTGIENPIM